MSEELDQLYRDMVLDHSKRPRNFGRLDAPTGRPRGTTATAATGSRVYVKVEAGMLADVRFEGRGCAIDTAAASLMTEAVKGKSLAEVRDLFDRFHDAMTGPPDRPRPSARSRPSTAGKAGGIAGRAPLPRSRKCATLPVARIAGRLERRPRRPRLPDGARPNGG